jgi:alcohol dehydrogenase (cytochrome c)
LLLVACSVQAQVTYEQILHADQEPQDWLTYSGGYSSQRYSLLTQINRDNVKGLQLKWVHPFPILHKIENTPLVVDGVMYTGAGDPSGDEIDAIDAVTGRTFWTFKHPVAGKIIYDGMMRGVAVSGDRVFWATIDGHLIAVDAKNGQPIWDKVIAEWHDGFHVDAPPLVVRDEIIVGTATSEEGENCWIAAYDVKTGKELWKHQNIPDSPSDPGGNTWSGDSYKHGGASIWDGGSYDPETNLTYWGTGNPTPGWNGDERLGDNLYTDSVLALDADTGKMKWYYQFTPHDERDYDSDEIPVLANIEWQGKPRKVMLWANRNGFFYVFDRATGKFLLGKAFVKQNWNAGFDKDGKPILTPEAKGTFQGNLIEPGVQGGTNWYSPSYSPRTGLFYVSTWRNYSMILAKAPDQPDHHWVLGQRYDAEGHPPIVVAQRKNMVPPAYKTPAEGNGAVMAIEPQTGEIKWEFKMVDYPQSGVLTTASDLLFSGGDGNFFALDARSGESLWEADLGALVGSGPMTYSVNGHQYVAVCSGSALYVFGLPQ